jgi:hypothetical protein
MSEDYDGLRYWRWLKTQHGFKAIAYGAAKILWSHGISVEEAQLSKDDVLNLARAYVRRVRPCHARFSVAP